MHAYIYIYETMYTYTYGVSRPYMPLHQQSSYSDAAIQAT